MKMIINISDAAGARRQVLKVKDVSSGRELNERRELGVLARRILHLVMSLKSVVGLFHHKPLNP